MEVDITKRTSVNLPSGLEVLVCCRRRYPERRAGRSLSRTRTAVGLVRLPPQSIPISNPPREIQLLANPAWLPGIL